MKRFIVLTLLGMATLIAAVLMERWNGYRVGLLRLHAMDWATVRVDGLRLGKRPASDDIVLILVDSRTAAAVGNVSSISHDKQLYQQLFNSGARVIYDSRPLIAADMDSFAQYQPLLDILVECTFENEGTLDKFIGDAILVLFNAPISQSDHVQRAIKTAAEMQTRLIRHKTGLKVGIGIHCGEAVVGNVGTQQRLEYTAIGNTVNIASRLCSLAQPGEVIVSSAVIEAATEDLKTESLGPMQVKGIKQSVHAYRVVDEQA